MKELTMVRERTRPDRVKSAKFYIRKQILQGDNFWLSLKQGLFWLSISFFFSFGFVPPIHLLQDHDKTKEIIRLKICSAC